MSPHTKSILILVCTLAAGVLIGSLGTSAWQHRRNVEVYETRRPGGLVRHIERVIEIEDDAQRQAINAILVRAEQTFMLQRRRMMDSLAVHRQLLLSDLEQILEPDQMQRLEAWLSRERTKRHHHRTARRSGRRERSKDSSG